MRFHFSVCPLFLLATTLVVSVASGQQQDATITADASNATPLKKKKLEGKKQIHIPPGITTRVVGGTQVTKKTKYPFFVQWEDAGCGGSLIHDDIVLSAAHCDNAYTPFDTRMFMLGVKSETGILRTVRTNIVHPLYDKATSKDYDYNVLKLHKSALVDDQGNPTGAQVAELNTDRNVPAVGDALQVVGYGLTNENNNQTSPVLNEATIYYISDDTCRQEYGDETFVPDLMFCAGVPGGGKDTCQGDSGGPVLEKSSWKQVGLVSFGVGCARASYAGVNARISNMIDWINEQVCALSEFPPPGCAAMPSRTPMGTGNGNMTVHIDYDYYPEETAWSMTFMGDVQKQLYFQPFYSGHAPLSSQAEPFQNLPAGLYRFRVGDESGDGICCDYGNGKIFVVDDNSGKTVYSNDGKFGRFREVNFTVDASGNVKLDGETSNYISSAEASPEVKNYPQRLDMDWPGPLPTDPFSINVVVKFDTFPKEDSWELAQLSGSSWTTVDSFDGATEGVASSEVVTPLTGLKEGWYRFSIKDTGNDGICCNFRRGWVALTGYLLATRRSGLIWGNSGEFGSGTEVYLQMNADGFFNRVSKDPPPNTA